MKQEDLKRMIMEELGRIREAMPLPLDDEDEDDRFTDDQREQDARLENPDLYYGDDDDDMSDRPTSDRLKDLLRDVEAGAAAVRAGEDYDFVKADALKAAKAAMMDGDSGEDVEDAIYAKLYYEYFPEFLQEGESDEEEEMYKRIAQQARAAAEMRKRFQQRQARARRPRSAGDFRSQKDRMDNP
jgi:hypothetical protein